MKKNIIDYLVILGITTCCLLVAIINVYFIHTYLKPYLYAHPNMIKHEGVEIVSWLLFSIAQFWISIIFVLIGRKSLINQRIIKPIEKKIGVPESKFDGMFPGFHDC